MKPFERFEINISRFSVEKRATADIREREKERLVEQSRQRDRPRGFDFIAFSYDNLRKIPFVPRGWRMKGATFHRMRIVVA